MITLIVLAVLILPVILFFRYAPQLGGKIDADIRAQLEKSPNYKGGKFINRVETPMPSPKFSTMVEFFKKGNNREPQEETTTQLFNADKFKEEKILSDIQFTWFGHSSVLLQIEGKTILFDPVFGERASMFSFIGPKKYDYSNEMSVEDLPSIDAVLISHDHYDHLDYASILKLKDRVNKFYTPLGVGVHLKRWGVPAEHIVELDWWESTELNGLELMLTPSRHFSGRGLSNRDKTLWGAWAVHGTSKKVFFSGDSGYFDGFKEVGEKYGPYDLAFIECGQYNEEWANIHMMPEESAQAGADLKARQVVPIHWGKFTLSLHSWTEPIERFVAAAAAHPYQVITPVPGDVVELTGNSSQVWWQSPGAIELTHTEHADY